MKLVRFYIKVRDVGVKGFPLGIARTLKASLEKENNVARLLHISFLHLSLYEIW